MTMATHRDLAQRYLQSVVVLDDRLSASLRALDSEPTELEEPNEKDYATAHEDYADEAEVPASHGVQAPATAVEDKEDDAHGAIDGLALVDQFAQLGLVCSLISPHSGADFESNAIRAIRQLAHRADAFIFDWRLYGDQGRLVQQLIGELVDPTGPRLARVRMIVVYTSQMNRADIRDQIASHLRDDGVKVQIEGNPPPGSDGPALLHGEDFRVSVLGKPHTITGSTRSGSHVLGIEALPRWLVDEFAKVTDGLLRGVALEALAALRDNTSHLLTRVGPEVDPAFVSHSYLTQAGPEFAVQLINQELETIVSAKVKADSVNDESLTEWVRDRFAEDEHLPHVASGIAPLPVTGDVDEWLGHLRNQMRKLVSKPLPTTSEYKPKLEHFATVTSLFVDPPKAQEADMKMGAMSSLARTLLDPVYSTPSLHLGTVLRDTNGAYWLCLQPMCDSVRIPADGRAFPLSPLRVVGQKEAFDLIVPVLDPADATDCTVSTSWVRLKRRPQPHLMKMPIFKPTGDTTLVSPTGPRPEQWRIESVDGKEFAWIAELRPQHGQRIANDNAGQVSRVGLDESEWLRLSGANKTSKDAAPRRG